MSNIAEKIPLSNEEFVSECRIACGMNKLSRLNDCELLELPVSPLSRIGDDVIEFPTEYFPPNCPESSRQLKIAEKLVGLSGFREKNSPHYVSLCRMLVALRYYPRPTRTGSRTVKPRTWLQYAKLLIHFVRDAFLLAPSNDGSLLRHLTQEQLDILSKDHNIRHLETIMQGMTYFHRKGVIDDSLQPDLIGIHERPYTDETVEENRDDTQVSDRTYSPFPDEFVVAFISRCLWISNKLAPPVLECYAELIDPQLMAHNSSSNPKEVARRKAIIAAYDWTDDEGNLIKKFPFPLKYGASGNTKSGDWGEAFVPVDAKHFKHLIHLIQRANLHILFFATGARVSEISGATRGSVALSKDEQGNVLDGGGKWIDRTWKLAERTQGDWRSWPVPPQAVNAIKCQERLAEIVNPGSSNLWISNDREVGGTTLGGVNEGFKKTISDLGLEKLVGDHHPHTHRWRKTIARLAAIALIGAPKILMDLFGHKDIEMTLRYILSSPDLQAEIRSAAKAINFATSKKVLEDAESLQGPKAQDILDFKEDIAAMHGRDELDSEAMDEAVELLTMGGRHWTSIRPGVLCTKAPKQVGKCVAHIGRPDPARCQQNCHHRLETAKAKDDCEGSIQFLLAKLKDSETPLMARESYKGELLAQMGRFPDLSKKFQKDPCIVHLSEGIVL